MKKLKSKISIIAICLVILIVSVILLSTANTDKLSKVRTKGNLERLYNSDDEFGSGLSDVLKHVVLFPWSVFIRGDIIYTPPTYDGDIFQTSGSMGTIDSFTGGMGLESNISGIGSNKGESSDVGDYSSTNIQVENVDEADIIKTDGEYIYSISDYSVIITEAKDPQNPVVLSEIQTSGPEEILIHNNKLVILSSTGSRNTEVEVYDITAKSSPSKIKSFTLRQDYYTSRIVNNNLYVISNGYLQKNNGEVVAYYTEDSAKKDIGYDNMYYFKKDKSKYETIISRYDLNDSEATFDVNAYLMDLDNIYISEKNIYLADEKYEDIDLWDALKSIFGFKGIAGLEDLEDEYDGEKTKIHKFELAENGEINHVASGEVDGTTINQFSFDEYNSNLRVAIDTGNYTRVVVLDKNLKLIGQTPELAEDENMYSSRFIGDRAYLVTYKTIDPLFVIDLKDPTDPKVLGELKIPGYSTYLHPYDENHIIGIGMQTEERVYRNSEGKILSTSAVITGMKMALFDVSNVTTPKQISEVVIGDSRTKSAILNNHKALLFSKEKELIAIPIESYPQEIEEVSYSDDISKVISNYNKNYYGYISEGYLVYNINLEDGITEKGLITHDAVERTNGYYTNSYGRHLLRGIYIKDYLYTVSQQMVQVHKLDTLEKVGSTEI